jgi:hypothetical protein
VVAAELGAKQDRIGLDGAVHVGVFGSHELDFMPIRSRCLDLVSLAGDG